jgi:hypothetical protein
MNDESSPKLIYDAVYIEDGELVRAGLGTDTHFIQD